MFRLDALVILRARTVKLSEKNLCLLVQPVFGVKVRCTTHWSSSVRLVQLYAPSSYNFMCTLYIVHVLVF